jgi:sugar lactone lactonase YvrE
MLGAGLLPGAVWAQGTKLWTVDRYEQMEKGTASGVAVASDGRLEPGPAATLVYDTGKSYVWSLTADTAGNAYVGLGGANAGSAAVMKVAPDGKATKVLDAKEISVEAMKVAADGTVFAATSPDGKVYRVPAKGGDATVVFDAAQTEEKPKYLWDLAVGSAGDVYVAAGAPAVVYRLPAGGGKAEVLFKTADQHIRCLMMAQDGTLWAGTDGSGVIYRIDTKKAGAKPFAAYAAPRREITSLAMDAAGNVYAAGVGGKGSVPLPPLPVTGTTGVTITFVQPGSSTAASANTMLPEGSEVYRIGSDGIPERLVALKEDVVYALAFHEGALWAATGNRGRIYRIDVKAAGQYADVAHLEASQGMAFATVKGGLLTATSNGGKLYTLTEQPKGQEASYTSEVFDAQGYSQWGRAELRGSAAGSYDVYVRTGNVESPLMGWSEWTRVGADGAAQLTPGRFAQWKAVLRPGAWLDSVGLNYLTKNVPPVVDEIVVQTGAKVPVGGGVPQNTNVQIVFPSTTPAISFPQDANTGPLTAQKDRTSITARWQAHDDNGDDLMFAVWCRGVGETNWRLLKDKISDRFWSFDSALLPDGSYELKVVASDSPVHTDADALTGEKTGPVFVVDTTPPVPGVLTATLAGGKIHGTLEARDATSPIAHAEYSVDAGPWQYLEPVGKVSDSQTERYDFMAEVPATTGVTGKALTNPAEHVLAVRVYDRYENMTAVKTVVK